MLVETMDVITLTMDELQQAIIQKAEAQSGRKVLKAKVEIVWADNAPAELRADGTMFVEGARISGVMRTTDLKVTSSQDGL